MQLTDIGANLTHSAFHEDLDAVHVCPPRTLAAPRDQAVDSVGLALEGGLHGTVVAIANPARETRRRGHAFATVPKEHSLHAPVHDDP